MAQNLLSPSHFNFNFIFYSVYGISCTLVLI